ncbi:MAG: NUDIX hydrolase [Nostoc sp. GBBB01]|jgi:ADP-ribose pyrophosphatase|uniref:NUDIX hydrolase n=1 Tax=Nostoc punctiforme FACHB-252 TaxID=1357509 RepID=A0ABR8HHS4_NOSPU|nr:NUDIX hydrolase [Nostoc punctiforme]MBD2615339.1 NUDIX hydrolase [Nostoc punctiforme FACHB-252]MBL1200902.1 NUDIX hydrolase [Nostoc sp. GBBB01]
MDSLDWTLLSSQYLVQDKWLTLRADTCQMPDGKIVERFYIFEYPAWVVVIALTKNQEVVLVKQYRHGIQKTVLEFPGGSTEPEDISSLEAAKRELLEETGYTSKNFIELGRLSPNSATHNNLIHCFLATDVELTANVQLDVTEDISIVLLPIQKLIELIDNHQFFQTVHISSLFLALKKLGKLHIN